MRRSNRHFCASSRTRAPATSHPNSSKRPPIRQPSSPTFFHILFPSPHFTTQISSSFYLSIFQSLLLCKISNSKSFHLSVSLCLYSSITSVWSISLYLSITWDQFNERTFPTFRNSFVSAGRQKVRGKNPNWFRKLKWWFKILSWWLRIIKWFRILKWWFGILKWWFRILNWLFRILKWWFRILNWWFTILKWWFRILKWRCF